MSALDRILNQAQHDSLWRDDAEHRFPNSKAASQGDGQWTFACHAGSPTRQEDTVPSTGTSFQAHSHDLGLGDTLEKLLSDGCCSSENSENDDGKDDSPTPEFLPTLDWSGVRRSEADEMPAEDANASPTFGGSPQADLSSPASCPTSPSDLDMNDIASRHRYRRVFRPRLDIHQQRATIDAEIARKREDHNAMMAQQQQLTLHQMGVAAKILCNEAHRRHAAQIALRRAAANTASSSSTDQPGTPMDAAHQHPSAPCSPFIREADPKCVSAAWQNVAECVEESLFYPGAVQARLSCMGIFRNDMRVGDLICYDDHEDERIAIRIRQQQIIDILRCQAMAGQNPFFLEKPFDFRSARVSRWDMNCESDDENRCDEEDPYSPTSFIPMGDF